MKSVEMMYMLIGGDPAGLAGHCFEDRADAEAWMRQEYVVGRYGLDEVAPSGLPCQACGFRKRKHVRRIYNAGEFPPKDERQ